MEVIFGSSQVIKRVSKDDKSTLFFYNEADLIEALKTHKKSSVFVIDDENAEMMAEGERLSKKLNLYFQHP